MENQEITELSPEQREKLSFYRDKWDAIELRTEPLDREKAKKGMLGLLDALDLPQPAEMLFFESPAAAFGSFPSWQKFIVAPLDYEWSDLSDLTWKSLGKTADAEPGSRPVESSLVDEIYEALKPGRDYVDWYNSWADDCLPENALHDIVYSKREFCEHTDSEVGWRYWLIEPVHIIPYLGLLDYCHQELGVSVNEALYNHLSLLAQNSSLIFAFNGVVVFVETPVSFRPPRKMPEYYRGHPLGQDPVYPEYENSQIKISSNTPPNLDLSDPIAYEAWTTAQELIRAEQREALTKTKNSAQKG